MLFNYDICSADVTPSGGLDSPHELLSCLCEFVRVADNMVVDVMQYILEGTI